MAESPVITCPECAKKFKGKGDFSGKRIRCPFCSSAFVVPASPGQSATPPSTKPPIASAKPAAQAAPVAAAKANTNENPDPYGITELDTAPRCPNCANELADEKAFICLFCGYNTLTRELGKTEKSLGHTFGEHLLYLLPGLLSFSGVVTMICGLLYFSLVLPAQVLGSWAEFLDHESMRLWLTVLVMPFMWGLGYFAFNRIVVNPTPPLKTKG